MNTMLHQSHVTKAQALANKPLTLEDINVSQGITRASETPLWVGKSGLLHPRNGTRLVMGVSKDKDWFWVRFSYDLKPEDNALMEREGWSFSKKKRLGYSAASTPTTAKMLRWLGYHDCQHVVYTPPVAPAKQKAVSTPNEGVVKGKITSKETHTMDEVRYLPSANRWINSKGHFVKPPTGVIVKETHVNKSGKVTQVEAGNGNGKGKMPSAFEVGYMVGKQESAQGLSVNPDNGYTGEEFEQYVVGYMRGYKEPTQPAEVAGIISWEDAKATDDTGVDESDAYQEGYEAGLVDGLDEEIASAYDVDTMARVLSVTVAELVSQLGTSYIDGWLTGFAEVRPAPVKKGIKARLVRK